jgi:hypothetical protein
MGTDGVQLEVVDRGDRLRRERLTRELHEHLEAEGELTAAGLRVTTAPPLPAPPGSKGTLDNVIMLLVAGAPYAQPAADALTAAIEGWCKRDRRVAVRIRDGDRSVEIVGDPTDQQRQLVSQFWSDRADDGSRR